MNPDTPRKLALFIDADNVSPSDLETVFSHLHQEGYLLPVRRAYGGGEKLSGLKEVLRKHAVRAFVNQGKGTTDVLLTVDAMDYLHSSQLLPHAAIVSSDADFAPLSLRLREADIHVICFANRLSSTPGTLALAYEQVVFVGDLPTTGTQSGVILPPVIAALPVAHMKAPVVSERPAQHAVLVSQTTTQKPANVFDDPLIVRRILEVLPGWLPNTVKNLNQIGGPLRAGQIAKGSKPLHELFRKHPSYFKVVPITGPAKQIKLLKLPG